MAHNYEKILAPFSRASSKDKYVDEWGKWAKPEFELLQKVKWVWTQKIDGTNLNIVWDGDKVSYLGHTDKTQWNDRAKKLIEETFCTPEAETVFEQLYGEQPVTVSMELVGKDYNQNYGHPDGYFYVFDIKNGATGKYWTNDEVLSHFVNSFDPEKKIMDKVQELFEGGIRDAVNYVKITEATWNSNFTTSWYDDGFHVWKIKNPLGPYPIEGIVGRLPIELYNSKNERVICKVKCKDFAN